MNQIDALKNGLKEIKNDIENSTNELNSALSDVGLPEVDLRNAISQIQKQVDSAESKFTIGFVGTFNTGKSTIINSLLGLEGDAKLSKKDDPDTAKCIRIISKEGIDYEAELVFNGDIPNEKVDWIEAKKYTSHVDIEAGSESFKARAKQIKEIRYYVDNGFLSLCNILDLPGTDSENSEDTVLTDEMIKECDCFFWIVTTDTEPGLATIQNLVKIKHKFLPIINVWQLSHEDINGGHTPEYIKHFLMERYSELFVNAEDFIEYYAREIEYAQDNGFKIEDKWGKEALVDAVQNILYNINSGDRASRMKSNLLNALTTCQIAIDNVNDSSDYKELDKKCNNDNSESINQIHRLEHLKNEAEYDIKDTAQKCADELLETISMAAESFIRNKMSQSHLNMLFRQFTKKQKKELEDELRDEFKKNYLKLTDGETNWTDKFAESFSKKVNSIFKGKYVDFLYDCSINDNINSSFTINEINGFINDIAEEIQDDIQSKIITMITSVITTGVLFLIPGGAILDAIASFLSIFNGVGNLANSSKLRSKIDMVVLHSKVEIRMQNYSISSDLFEKANASNDNYYNRISDKLKLDIENNSNKIDRIKKALKSLQNNIKDAETEVNKNIAKGE